MSDDKQVEIKISRLSVVVPVYNEVLGIVSFYDLLEKELAKLKLPKYEIIFVNDGSSDNTQEKLLELARKHANIKLINLTRNFGKEAALSAGLHNVSGDVVLTLDSDGQHPPAMIKDLLALYKNGIDMVVGVRTLNPDEKKVKKIGNRIYYRLLRLIGVTYLQPRVTDFRIMSREVVEAFCTLTERSRIARGLIDWMGYKTEYIEFESPERMAGTASYSTKKLIQLAIDSILSSSRKPLSLSVLVGVFITMVSLLTAIFVIFEKYIFGDPYNLNITGTATLGLIVLFMVGLILISQGISSLYLARIYEEAQQRPLYIIRKEESDIKNGEDVIS